jgi:hypothetical protein
MKGRSYQARDDELMALTKTDSAASVFCWARLAMTSRSYTPQEKFSGRG